MKLTLRSRAAVAALAGFGAALPASAQTTTPPAWASVRAVGPGSQSVGATAIDAAGNTYETGTFTVSTTVGSVALTSQGSNDAYLAKYAPGGNLLWVRQLGSTGSELGLDVAVDAAGNAYVVGSFTGTIALGNGSTLQLEGGHVLPSLTIRSLSPPAYWPASGSIKIESLSARYSPDGPLVLEDINLEIKSGERIGVVGRTGSGEQTSPQAK